MAGPSLGSLNTQLYQPLLASCKDTRRHGSRLVTHAYPLDSNSPRSNSEKILISVLMAFDHLAIATACAKTTTAKSFGNDDPRQGTTNPSLWAKLEEQICIIAVSASALKNHAERLLEMTGVPKVTDF